MRASAAIALTLGGLLAGAATPWACSPFGAEGVAADAGLADATADAPSDAATPDAGGAPYAEAVLADGPLAYFRFDEPATPRPSTLRSEVGAATLSVVGAAQLGVPGLVGASVAFDGSAGPCLESSDPLFETKGLQAYTLEAWMRAPATDDQYRHLFIKDGTDGTGRQEYGVYLRRQDAANCVDCVVFERIVSNGNAKFAATFTPDQWHHVVAVFDGARRMLYVDGAERATASDGRSAAAQPGPFRVGCKSATEGPFRGGVDEVAFYARALGAERVAAHYAARSR